MRRLWIAAAVFAAFLGTMTFGHAGLETNPLSWALIIRRSCGSRMDAMALRLIPFG